VINSALVIFLMVIAEPKPVWRKASVPMVRATAGEFMIVTFLPFEYELWKHLSPMDDSSGQAIVKSPLNAD
jgi:hypothetical protein